MNNKFCGFIPFKDEQSWWLNLQDLDARNLATCCGCGRDFQESDLDEQSGLCGDCDRTLDAAIVIVEVDECPFYDEDLQAANWYAIRARDRRYEARCDREGR